VTTKRWRRNGARKIVVAVAAAGAVAGLAALQPDPGAARADEGESAEGVTFLHPLDDRPIELTLRPDQEITPAVEEFHRTAENPYRGDPEAIAVGERLYRQWCQVCHMPDGSGRMGPSLIDDSYRYPRTHTDQGMFEVIYAGGAGAMQAFGQRMDQDEILKLMAYVETLGND
jgi:cytochrome c-L